MLLLLACDFSAATKILDDSAVVESAADSGGDDTADSTGTTKESDSVNPFEVDDDKDGSTENEGDCDDDDPSVHPGATDGCDGVDNDCDGDTDEDGGIDEFEPNDSNATDLGSLEDNPNMAVSGTLQNDADVDRFQFTIVDDLTDFFTVTATLSNVPTGADWRFTLNRLRSDGKVALGKMDSVNGDGTLTLSFSDDILQEDGGDYELVVEALSGADCSRSYLLGIKQ